MDLVHDHDRRHLVGHLGRVTKRRRGGRGGHGDSAGRMIQGPGPGAATGIREARERTPLTVTVQCASGSRRVRVQYDRTLRGDPPKHRLVFCLADSNGSPASRSMKTAFTFSSDGDSPSPSLDDQTATAIARFVQKKVDKGQLELPRESPTDPMEVEVEPQDPSGECFRLRLGQKEKGGIHLCGEDASLVPPLLLTARRSSLLFLQSPQWTLPLSPKRRRLQGRGVARPPCSVT